MRFLYIHGFASSPESRKARQFEAAFATERIPLEIPLMDEGDFEHLTISRQLNVLERTLHNDPVSLIGSSMGGYLAALYAAAHPEVSRLVLLAPAFGFANRWLSRIGQPPPASLDVYHYGENRMRRVHFGLIEDALRYPANPAFTQPARIFHGLHDDIVPIDYSRVFAAAHPNAQLVELDSGHELLTGPGGETGILDSIVAQSMSFLLA